MGQCLFSFVVQEHLIVYRFFCPWFGYIYIYIYINHFVKIYKESTLTKKKKKYKMNVIPFHNLTEQSNCNETIIFHRIAVTRHDKLQTCKKEDTSEENT